LDTFIVNIVGPIAVAIIGYLGLNFVGKDIVSFRDLRREILQELDNTANVDQREGDEARWDQASSKLRSLSVSLSALHETSNWIVRWYFWRYDYNLPNAARHLMGISNSLGGRDWHRASHRYKVEQALKFPHELSKDVVEGMREVALPNRR
jgi:hypothetical protein